MESNDGDGGGQPGHGGGEGQAGSGKEPKKYEYFVDNAKYESDVSALTGAQIKAKIPNFDPAYQLVLEGHGHDPDRVIGDSETVSLEPKPHFYTAPPANFG